MESKYKSYKKIIKSRSKSRTSESESNSSRSRSRSRGKNYDVHSNSSKTRHTSRSRSRSRSKTSNSSRSSSSERYNENEDRYNMMQSQPAYRKGYRYMNQNYGNNFGKPYNFIKGMGHPFPYVPKYMNGGPSAYKYNKFQKPNKYYAFNKHTGPQFSNTGGEGGKPPFYANPRYQNYKLKSNHPMMLNIDNASMSGAGNSIQLPPNISQSTALFLNNINPDSMTPEQQAFLKKKLPNYRLLGRNIFDTNVKSQFMKSRKKTNTYYSRFLKQHPANNLPLAFQKSMSLAEDKALEEKEKQHKKEKKKKHKKDNNNSSEDENELGSSNSDSDTGNELENAEKKAHKFYSDISSDSDLEAKKKSKKKDKKKKKKKKQSKNKNDLSKSASSSESNSPRTSKTANEFLADLSDNDSDGSMMDLRENLKPIGDYMGNREQMLNEMLRCIKGSKLHAMLPDSLKDKPFDIVKSKCMDELESMSKKRLRYLILGKDMTSSSGTEESSDDGRATFIPNKETTEEINKNNHTVLSKFKPIDGSNRDKDDSLNKTDDHDESQDGSNNVADAVTVNDAPQVQAQQSGFVAAGFKKFVKKSISIKLKTTDPSINAGSSKQEDSKSALNTVEFKNDRQSLFYNGFNQPWSRRYEDTYNYDVDSDDYNEVRNELNSILESTDREKRTNYLFNNSKNDLKQQSNKYYAKSSGLYNNNTRFNTKEVNNKGYMSTTNQSSREIETNSCYDLDINATADSSCDYDYDIGDDLSNIDSEDEQKSIKKKKHKKLDDDSDASTYCSSCVDDDEFLISNNLDDSDNDIKSTSSTSSASSNSSISSFEEKKLKKHQKEKSSKKRGVVHGSTKEKKKDQSKSKAKSSSANRLKKDRKSKKTKSKEHQDQNSKANLLYVKNTLKNILEMHILNISDDGEGDGELKEILMSLLSELVSNESITLEECAFIHEKINELYFEESENDNDEEEVTRSPENNTKNKIKNEEARRRHASKSEELERNNKKRKRKDKSKDNILEKKKRVSNSEKDKNTVQRKESKTTESKLKKNVNINNNTNEDDDYVYNGKGEMMEAGEIDDMYDDEIIVERELENLLGIHN